MGFQGYTKDMALSRASLAPNSFKIQLNSIRAALTSSSNHAELKEAPPDRLTSENLCELYDALPGSDILLDSLALELERRIKLRKPELTQFSAASQETVLAVFFWVAKIKSVS